MKVREALPVKISEDTFRQLAPVFAGETLRKQGRYGEAESKYTEGLETFPEGSGGRFLLYNKLGLLYEEMADAERARAAYERAVCEGSMTPFPYLRLARLSFCAGRYAESADYAERGVKSLKRAHTSALEELYFWLLLKKLNLTSKWRLAREPKAETTE